MKRPEPKRMLRLRQLREIIPYSTPHIYDLMSQGKFPRSVKIGANAVAWIEDEIIAWQEAHIARRDARETRKTEAA